MTTQEAIDHLGGIKQLAQFLDIYPQAIYNWGEYPPRGKQYELQVRTNGELQVESENGLTTESK